MSMSNIDQTMLSPADQASIASLQAQNVAAKASKTLSAAAKKQIDDSTHAAAEAIRAKYGYSGGSWGNQYIPVKTVNAAMNVLNPTTSTGVPIVGGNQGSAPVQTSSPTLPDIPNVSNGPTVTTDSSTGAAFISDNSDSTIVPGPMTANFQRVLTIGLFVIGLGFVAKIFSRGR